MSNYPSVSFVPTPIGNLGDITERSVETLKACDIIFAEDTRTARSLMNALDIKKPVESYHKDNEASASARIINAVNEGKKVCLISEAGTPCISDPGNTLTAKLVDENISFQALPGAVAFVPALLMSGFPVENFYFYGFLPHKKSEKVKAAEKLRDMNTVIAFYESPHRVRETIEVLLDVFPEPVFCAREISKVYESVYHIRTSGDLDNIIYKGEFVLVVNNRHEAEAAAPSECIETARKLIKGGYESKEALNIMKALGYKRNDAYSAIQDVVKS